MHSIFKRVSPVTMLAGLAIIVACSTTPPSGDQQDLLNNSKTAFNDFTSQDPTLQPFLDKSYAYAIYPSIGKGAIGIGGAYGRGVVVQNGQNIGWTDVTQGSLGAELGGETYSELVVFKDKEALDNFKSGDFALAATVSAVAAASGAAGQAKFDNGVTVFVRSVNGLMFEASIGGQSFGYRPMSQASSELPPPPAVPATQSAALSAGGLRPS
jgi:lipid-binding SYLF domain-containing protein